MATLDCFDGLIYLGDTCDDCDSPANDGLGLGALGITESFLAQITDDETTPRKLLRQAEELARKSMAGDVLSRTPGVVKRTITDRRQVAVIKSGIPAIDPARKYGVLVRIDPRRSSLVVDVVSKALIGGTPTWEIFDARTGQQITDWQMRASGRREEYFITGASVTSGNTVIDANGGMCCGGCPAVVDHGLTVTAASVPASGAWSRDDVAEAEHTGGAMLTLTMRCDHEQWLCDIREALAVPYLYKVGQAIMDRALMNVDRLTNVTNAQEALTERAARYEKEYQDRMQNIMAGIRPKHDGVCFTCPPSPIHSRNNIP